MPHGKSSKYLILTLFPVTFLSLKSVEIRWFLFFFSFFPNRLKGLEGGKKVSSADLLRVHLIPLLMPLIEMLKSTSSCL